MLRKKSWSLVSGHHVYNLRAERISYARLNEAERYRAQAAEYAAGLGEVGGVWGV
jgi:hypothetical protein